jgi:hypothetical protein
MTDQQCLIKLLQYIDALYDLWSAKPQAYAASPQSLEEVFIAIETLREYMLSDSNNPPLVDNLSYYQFLENECPQCGVFTFTAHYYPTYREPVSEHEEDLFMKFIECWKQYRSSKYRKAACTE